MESEGMCLKICVFLLLIFNLAFWRCATSLIWIPVMNKHACIYLFFKSIFATYNFFIFCNNRQKIYPISLTGWSSRFYFGAVQMSRDTKIWFTPSHQRHFLPHIKGGMVIYPSPPCHVTSGQPLVPNSGCDWQV